MFICYKYDFKKKKNQLILFLDQVLVVASLAYRAPDDSGFSCSLSVICMHRNMHMCTMNVQHSYHQGMWQYLALIHQCVIYDKQINMNSYRKYIKLFCSTIYLIFNAHLIICILLFVYIPYSCIIYFIFVHFTMLAFVLCTCDIDNCYANLSAISRMLVAIIGECMTRLIR